MSVESYAHKAAKAVVVGWLRDAAARVGRDYYTQTDPLGINWRVNRPGPHWGVWEEYPVLADGTGVLPVWDETWDGPDNRPPTRKELLKIGLRPVAIFDIAIQHKGYITTAIEIVHKHAPSEDKLDTLRMLEDCPSLLVLPAKWVLGQIGVPKKLPPEEFWYWGKPYAYRKGSLAA